MLTAFDDYLIHQTPDTFDRVFTSDHHFTQAGLKVLLA